MAQTPLQPLSVGNVVSAAFRLYRDHMKTYFGVALRATLWSLFPFVLMALLSAIVIPIFLNVFETQGAAFGVAALILIPVGLLILFYCGAKSLLNSALIAKLAFGMLVDRPESVIEARKQLQSKLWRFLWVQLLVTILLLVANFGLSIVQSIVIGIFSAILQDSLAIAIVSLLIGIASTIAYLYVSSRLLIPEVPLALENNLTTTRSIERSWNLSQGCAGRILSIFLVAFLISLPLYGLAAVPFILFAIRFASEASSWASGTPSPAILLNTFTTLGASLLLFLVMNIFLIPFWQALKAVVYYDLRIRKEGLDLQWRDSQT